MTGRDQRLLLQREAAQARREREALAEVRAAAEAMRDAGELGDPDLLRMAASRVRRVNPDLLPERWAAWVRKIRAAQA